MKTKYSNEELLHSLPDYISNKLTDSDLKNAIELKISSDPDFKMEYANLIKTIETIGQDMIVLPSDTYFNNLSVRINEAINKETQPVSFLEKFGISLKLALPALAVLLIITTIFLYMSSLDNDSNISNNTTTENINDNEINKATDENIQTDIDPDQTDSKKDLTEQNDIKLTNKEDKEDKIKNRKTETVFKKTENTDKFINNEKSVFPRDKEPSSGSLKAMAFDNLALLDNSDSDHNENTDNSESMEFDQEDNIFISGESEEDFLEEDLFELTPEEQKEIVEFLKQS